MEHQILSLETKTHLEYREEGREPWIGKYDQKAGSHVICDMVTIHHISDKLALK